MRLTSCFTHTLVEMKHGTSQKERGGQAIMHMLSELQLNCNGAGWPANSLKLYCWGAPSSNQSVQTACGLPWCVAPCHSMMQACASLAHKHIKQVCCHCVCHRSKEPPTTVTPTSRKRSLHKLAAPTQKGKHSAKHTPHASANLTCQKQSACRGPRQKRPPKP